MPYQNIHRGARISPLKVRPVIGLIRGKSVAEAMTMMRMSKRRAAAFILRGLEAAFANADQAEADVQSLVVTEAKVDGGPTIKRFQPKDRGRAHPIKKRTSHITVVLDEVQVPQPAEA